jgi:hypothetical protein
VSFLRGNARRRNMAEAARRLGRPEAAAAIVDDLCAWLGMPTDGAASDDGNPPLSAASGGVVGSSSEKFSAVDLPRAVVRRPKVRRAPLRVRAIDIPIDITG